MSTQKPLRQLVPDILRHIIKWEEYTKFNQRVYHILQGQIREEVECALQKEILSPSALNRIKERIPPINVLRKVSDKLCEVYVEPPSRLVNKKSDLDLLDVLARAMKVDKVLENACRMFIAQHMVAIEPYTHKRKQKLRVLGAHQCLPYSDDPVNPTEMTVFIKYLGKKEDLFTTPFDDDGVLIENDKLEPAQVYALYSDSEWLVVDSGGNALPQLMSGSDGTHDFGRIPQVLIRENDQELIPFPNKEGFDISILIPKLLADLNFAAQFATHSIIWSRNADLNGQQINPDAVVDLGSADRDEGVPEIGVIKPEVDIDRQLLLTNYQLVGYLNGKGIKISSESILSNGRDSSAIGKAVDESDTTSARKKIMELMRCVEDDLWDSVVQAQRVWSKDGLVDERRIFTTDMLDSLSITYAEIRPVKTRGQLLEEHERMRALGSITVERMLRELEPQLSEEQLGLRVKELDDEKKSALEDMMMGAAIPGGAGRDSSGQFGQGNTAAASQDETSKTEENNDEKA